MRLIYYVLFLFCSFGANLVKAGPTLDLDTYDPEEFDFVLERKSDYNIEQFTPKSNDQITKVTGSGNELYTSYDSQTVSNVKVYSIHSVPQIVEINLSGSSTPQRFQKKGNEYKPVDETQFGQLVSQMENHNFVEDLEFTLNIESNFTPRKLFNKKDDVVDGVVTHVFTPESQPQMTLVKDGPLTLATASNDEHFTRVTVSLKSGKVYLALVESSKNNTSHAYYFQKQHSWRRVTKEEYESLLAGLHPVDVFAKVTLDIDTPNDQHFKQERDYDSGLTEIVYKPLPGFECVKVTSGTTELWSSNVNRSSQVVVYSIKTAVKLVKIEVKNADAQTTEVLLSEDNGGFLTVNGQEFSNRLQKLKDELSRSRTPSEGSVTLDVASPNHNEFQVVERTFKGVHYKEFARTNGHSIPKVESSGNTVFDSPSNVAVTHVNVYMQNGVPTLYQVSGIEAGSVPFNTLLKLDNGNPVTVDSLEFHNFLKTAAKPPRLSEELELDLENPEQENVAVYSSRVYGLDNMVAQANDGFYFTRVTFGDKFVWSVENHPGVSLTQVVAFKNKTLGNNFKLLELEGFKSGNYVSFYYEKQTDEWRHIDQPTFQNKFRLLKFQDLGLPASQTQRRRLSPDFLFPTEMPEESTTPESPEEPTTPETPEEPEQTQPELPEEPIAPLPPSDEFEVVHLDTDNVDETKVQMIAGSEYGYYFKSFSPRYRVYIGSVNGPNGFKFDGNGARLVTLVKFFWVHTKLVGAKLFTISVALQTPLIYFYTLQNNEWEYSLNHTKLDKLIEIESAYTNQQKADLEHLREQTEKFRKIIGKLKEKEQKELDKKRKQEEKENRAIVPKQLSHKTRLYDDMADLEQHPPPKVAEVVETEEELNKRRHSYAGGDKILVESELLYFELSNPKTNDYVHTKDYTCMGLPSIDVTPFAGRYLHVVSLHGKRVWVSSNSRRATNMQLFYADDQIVGALLKVTSVVRGTTVTGEEFDYLFVKDGELQKVNVTDFMNLANTRFQSAALVNLSRTPKTP